MTTFRINTEWIERVRDGHNNNWNYDYKEYIFNDNYTEAYAIRVPQNALGIQAMLLSNDSGIKAEYSKVILVNGDHKAVIYDMSKQYERTLQHENKKLQDRVHDLELRLAEATTKLNAIRQLAW